MRSTYPAFSAAEMDMCLLSSGVGVARNCRGWSVVTRVACTASQRTFSLDLRVFFFCLPLLLSRAIVESTCLLQEAVQYSPLKYHSRINRNNNNSNNKKKDKKKQRKTVRSESCDESKVTERFEMRTTRFHEFSTTNNTGSHVRPGEHKRRASIILRK